MLSHATSIHHAADLHRVRRAIAVVDVIESVRLMQSHEDDVIDRWRRFVDAVRDRVLPRWSGRMVKSLGDGFLMEFASASSALAAAFEILDLVRSYNVDRDAARSMQLRSAIHVADVVIEVLDVYGAGVNLAARLASLGRPDAVVLSAEAVDDLAPSLGIKIDDLGECWLKHFDEPVRAFLVSRNEHPLTATSNDSLLHAVRLSRSIAVVPLTCHVGSAQDDVIGHLLADGVIAQLASTPELLVLSRMAAAALRGVALPIAEAGHLTGARYVLGGSYTVNSNKIVMTLELSETDSEMVVWSDRIQCSIGSLLEHPSEPIDRITQGVHTAILAVEAGRTASQPLPNLESASLLFGGIGLLHRAATSDFVRARDALVELAQRVPRHPASHAWLAQWHCLRVIRGHASFTSPDAQEARFRIDQALERDPASALAWALRGLVISWINKDLDEADSSLRSALAHNPSEPLAWLFTATLRSWQGRGAEAAAASDRALALSRLHPLRYYFSTLSAAGYLADGRHERAIELCSESLRLNRSHTPSHRVLAIALVLVGRAGEARRIVKDMLALQPGFTVRRYLDAYPGGRVPHAMVYAQALAEAGLPH